MVGILEGLRVVDCSRGTAGPQATGLLADYGADVVWVEPPGGDPFRRHAPAAASVFNRGKRSVVLDLKDAGSTRQLVALTGAPTCSSRVGAPASPSVWVSTSTRCTPATPRLVYCSISGFGADGPYRDCRGYESFVHAVVGTMAQQAGHREGPIFQGCRSRAPAPRTSRWSARSPRSIAVSTTASAATSRRRSSTARSRSTP